MNKPISCFRADANDRNTFLNYRRPRLIEKLTHRLICCRQVDEWEEFRKKLESQQTPWYNTEPYKSEKGKSEILAKMDKEVQEPSELEKRYVHQVYNKIAPHVNQTRYKAWPKVRTFLSSLPDNSLVADIGCGNGKYSKVNDKIYLIGCDVCAELLETAKSKSNQSDLLLANNLSLPFRDNTFDALISIAVIHHFSTVKRRKQAIREMGRIVRPGGKIMIYVWALEQASRQFCAQDVLVPWHLQKIKAHHRTESVESTKDCETDPTRMVKVDKNLTREQRVIQGSVGIEPISEPQSPLSPQTVTWGQTVSQTVTKLRGKMWNYAPTLTRHQTVDINDQQYPISPKKVPPAIPPRLKQRRSTLGSIVVEMTKYSPMIGRKFANLIGTNPETENALQTAQTIWDQSYLAAVQEYLSSLAISYNIDPVLDNFINETPKTPVDFDDLTFYRYYHVFKDGELVTLVNSIENLKTIDSYYDHANWCVIAEKQ